MINDEKSVTEPQRGRYWQEYLAYGKFGPEIPEYFFRASSTIALCNLTEDELYKARMLERAQAIYDAEMYGAYLEGVAYGIAKVRAKAKAKAKAEGKVEGIELFASFIREGLSVEEAIIKAMDAVKAETT